eukprot:CAMPEP_0197623706 /NCGR_PEP_ID=MMETSP1338-20131121/3664_1 /TAXON_ID=43686 ORGANISM="Pelagodinium beii, Strain RCC1491" /NCGR_SAMPLE_ID=MMETSP1338 /ASSEMBLY_ACC=CAM_ASM_000754 /LENGTH=486 /DNA_ID=CAMNT_0043193765 /DNA_START=37 /DNA_END=1494 /DNA_ORIENTATION=+
MDTDAATIAAAKAFLAEGKYDDALERVESAITRFQTSGNREMLGQAMRTKVDIYLQVRGRPEARAFASEAAAVFRQSNDSKGEAAAQALVAEVCTATHRYQEATLAAREALRLSKSAGDQSGQAAALKALLKATAETDRDKALVIASERIKLLREMHDRAGEANALTDLARVHVQKLSNKLKTCSIASADDSLAALRASKDAHGIFSELRNLQGQAAALQIVARVLLYNGVHPDVIEASRDPTAIFADVMSGKYSSSRNAFPPPANPKQVKLEEAVPDSKQLDRGKFGWTNATAGYCYTVVWQPTKDRHIGNNKPRGQYDILTARTGYKHNAVATTLGMRANDASERNDALMVFMTTQDHGNHYASSFMNAQHVIGGVVAAQLRKLVFVQFGESFYDWTDTSARTVEMHSVTLAILRSARIEAPFLTIGFVGGDAASWLQDPTPMIESIFDTIESDECEVIYRNGESFAPSMVHKPLDDTITAVKP